MSGLLDGKTAIIYGAGGGIGGGVARTFAREGAAVFLAGRTRPTLDAVAAEITAAGGSAERGGRRRAGRAGGRRARRGRWLPRPGSVDVSFNLISRGDVQGTPLVDMTPDDLLRAVVTGLRTQLSHRPGGRAPDDDSGQRCDPPPEQRVGRRGAAGHGQHGPADAATESFMRYLAAELARTGVRVCGIWTAGVAETLTQRRSPGSAATATSLGLRRSRR